MIATHNTASRWGYVSGCRCDECRAAEARYQRRRRNGDATASIPCWFCNEMFTTDAGRAYHQGKVHG